MYNYTSYPYASAHGRARFTKWLLIAGALIAVISILVTAMEFVFPAINSEEELSENPLAAVVVLLQMGVALLQLAIVIATIVCFLMWLYRAHNNLPAFGHSPNSLAYSSGWAIGSFFVPFANLVVPYRAIKEVWQKSEPITASFASTSPPATFPLWWFFWLVSNVADNMYFRMSSSENISGETLAIMGIASDALGIIAAICAIVVISEIDQRQEHASKSMALTHAAQPPLPPTFEPYPQSTGFTSS